MTSRPTAELCAGYEAMRATVTGPAVSMTPRGLGLVLAQGLPAWIRAWTPPPPAVPSSPGRERPVEEGPGAEVVRLLTEMALGCGQGLAAP